jgi:subfamily B ATP-binding cassette protein MsbA
MYFIKHHHEGLNAFKKEIVFDNVSFAYEDKIVIEKLNLSIPKGSSLALVGPSSSS